MSGIQDEISNLRHQILQMDHAYWVLNDPIASDDDYDRAMKRLIELEALSESSQSSRDAVDLDQSRVGRLSRIDALQMQAMEPPLQLFLLVLFSGSHSVSSRLVFLLLNCNVEYF